MFGLPDAKRVKRSKLFSTSSSPSSSEDERAEKHSNASRTQESNKKLSRSQRDQAKRAKSQGVTSQTDVLDDEKDVNVNYGFEYDFIDHVEVPRQGSSKNELKSRTSPQKGSQDNDDDDDDADREGDRGISDLTTSTIQKEQSYEFLLFKPTQAKTTATATTTTAKITIRSPTPEKDLSKQLDVGSILQPRHLSYCFTSHLPPSTLHHLRAEYTSAAVSGTQVQSQLSRTAWPGTRLSWRVIHVPSTTKVSKSSSPSSSSTTLLKRELLNRRTKPSKKRRIHLRQRIKAREQLLESTKMSEEAEREKRTRRNREKKVKRKEREKRKKNQENEGGEEKVQTGDGDGDGNGDGSTT